MAPFLLHKEFISYLVGEKRFSEHTCLAYSKDISQFFDFSAISEKRALREVDSRLIRGWIVDLMDNDVSSNTVNRKLSSLRTFFKWLLRENIVKHNPLKTVQGPKKKKHLPSFAKSNDLDTKKTQLLFGDDFDGIRDQLMFEVFYQTGIRSSELMGLLDANVNPESIKVLGKRNKERIIPISQSLYKLILTYREKRQLIVEKPKEFFLLNTGNKLYPKFVYRKINNYLSKATDLDKNSPHVLRHTFATHMLNNGAGLEVLKELLGHANLSATQIYTHNSFAQLTSIYSQSHPRGHKN